MRRVWRLAAWVLGVAVVLAIAQPLITTRLLDKPRSDKHAGKHGGEDGAIPVLTAKARAADVPVYVEGVGTGTALNSVLIRSQVDGILEKLNFVEGQNVKAGDLIAQIDPRLYKATYDQNVAKKHQDEALLANAKLDLARYKMLAQTKAGTQQQYDTQIATVQQDEAQVALDQATIDSSATTLSYTNITSPIAGRVGIRNVDVGNLVHATDTTGIVTVAQIQPMSVFFYVPQQELPRINKASLLGQLDVQAVDSNGVDVVDHGKLAAVNNQVDATTGTIKLRANFPNPQLQLWPGIFVNVRLKVETLKDAIVVPVAALQRGPKGPFVFTLDADKAKMTDVTVGQQDDTQVVVKTGLEAGEAVITSGFQKLTDGAKVAATPDQGAAAAAATGAPALHEQGVTPVAPEGAPPGRPGRGRRQRQSSRE
ncbi:efflux RND transporter periplasmic adaptor subunit [Jatrophihabitans endophyticus]|uniref:efflux RND transporter periplasmic adaptor subunit n=1 Tax=Jatrophihabitans endophyticus TaxID=1206085 RepID=UPI001A016DF7|nr:efflux RND transporter periplasmic adaptor subunit [Jatrophihabitans endophyticus]MBE7190163.1 efflux RND transporter periplasmic adaptor subunit [Jatrophihabitans endophyticus]